MDTRRLTNQVVIGGILIVVGIALLAETTDMYDASVLLEYVPSLFVLLGVYALVSSGFRNRFGPVVVIAVAGAWQLVALDYVEPEHVTQFWPLVIVAFGLSIILGQYRSRSRAVSDAYVSAIGVFGGSEQRPTTSAFEGADLTALFGGVELDLREAGIEQRPARVSATALFGGCEVVVPPEWNVQFDVLPIFGGAEDERKRRERDHDETDLVVTGFVAFGGVSVTD
ncbi:MAG: LiaI-LiaF-like domain-containing protein [Halorhabdus sp.]